MIGTGRSRSDERERDLHMLGELCDALSLGGAFDAFFEMLASLEAFGSRDLDGKPLGFEVLTDRQRRWAEDVCKRLGIDTTPPRLRKPVRGKEVELAPVLRTLPLKPPGRR